MSRDDDRHAAFWADRRHQELADRAVNIGRGGTTVFIPHDDPSSVWAILTPEQRRSFLEATSQDPDWRAVAEQIERVELKANGRG